MEFEENFEKILKFKQIEDDTIQRLCEYTKELRLELEELTDKKIKKLREQKGKIERFGESNEQMSKQLKRLESKLEEVILQQKDINEKRKDFETCEATIRADIKLEKSRKVSLDFEKDALQGENTNCKKAKDKEWNSLLMSTAIYKRKLNFHIDYGLENNHNKLKITFFHNDKIHNSNRDNYYVECLNYETTWKVQNIKPSLDQKYLEKIKLDFHREYDIHDITAFLCRIRKKFLENIRCYTGN